MSANDASPPLVVQAAVTEIMATGTAVVVRVRPSPAGGREALDVTLVEGQVVQGSGSKDAPAMVQHIVMAAGDRSRGRRSQDAGATSVTAVLAPEHDRPRLDQVLAWKRGETVLDNASLQEALAEMNRYSATPIMADPSMAALRISGLYSTGDKAGFSRAVAALHGVAVRAHADRLELLPK